MIQFDDLEDGHNVVTSEKKMIKFYTRLTVKQYV